MTNDEVVALTCDFFGALEVAGLVQSNLYVFECVTSKIHSFDRVPRCVTLPINFTRTNPRSEKGDYQPEPGVHRDSLNTVETALILNVYDVFTSFSYILLLYCIFSRLLKCRTTGRALLDIQKDSREGDYSDIY